MVDPGHVEGPQTSAACQKQHRQNEPAGWVDIATGAEVSVVVDPGHL